MRRFIGISIVFFLIAGITLYVMIFVVPDVENTQKKTTVIESGKLGLTDAVTAYFVRDEVVYLADKSGEVSYYIGEGIKTRKDTLLLEIKQKSVPKTTQRGIYADIIERMNESGVDLTTGTTQKPGTAPKSGTAQKTGTSQKPDTAQKTGIVSYYIDGYEKLFSPERLDFLTYSEAEGATGPAINVTRHEGDFARVGEPLYKIVDDSVWYLVFWLPTDSGKIAGYSLGENVIVHLPNGDITGSINRAAYQDNMWMIVVEFDKYYEDLAQARKVNAGFTTEEYVGLMIDNSSITTIDGSPGVYVKKKNGVFGFVPVKIIKSDGIKSIVWDSYFTGEDDKRVSTVKYYDEILIDPALMDGDT